MKKLARDKIREFPPISDQDMPQILIVDDDESICRFLTAC
jgi:hypothetical protein